MHEHLRELDSVYRIISTQARNRPADIAITAPGRKPLTYGELDVFTREIATGITGRGISAGDRVAIALPNGPEMATAFLAVASVATSAPLNPAYRESDFELLLTELRAKALLLRRGQDSPARAVAARLGVPILDAQIPSASPAGLFRLVGGEVPAAKSIEVRFAEPDEIALLLHTSGTTSRAKIVPLSQRNISASARNVARTLRLNARDRCLSVMPLFHIHGLIAGVLAPIASGGSTVCTPGFRSESFFDWLDECRPTWFTAVPTMHQAVLARAPSRPDTVSRSRLRFIRSSSAPLPPTVMSELESRFGAPVIESYGMTEASHQVTSNPLPPDERRRGCVGMAAGPEVAIMDESSRLLTSGETGEIVIRGANVTSGYEDNPEANAEAFARGWFRTGDEGYLDESNYLYITGRIKELINRGGEKVAPREIDEIFLEHPAIAQAVTFAVPHATLGEDVATAVILREGEGVDEAQLRDYASARLSEFKVPSQVVVVDDIPTGPSGKLQRIGLHEKLKHRLRTDYVAPVNELEEKVCSIWSEVLGREAIGTADNFFLSGGDSLLATQVLARVLAAFGVELPYPRFFRQPTVSDLAAMVAETSSMDVEDSSKAVPTMERRESAEVAALSFSQERAWFLDQLQPRSPAYNRPVLLELKGPLNVSALAHAVNEAIRRHEALRTIFPLVDGHPVQQVQPHRPIALEPIEVDGVHETNLLAVQDARRPFNLATGPVVRATLFRLDPKRHRLQLVVHHIACDAWSASLLIDEIAQAYKAHDAGEAWEADEPTIRYRDFSRWQRHYSQGETLESHLAFWRSKLSGSSTPLNLPLDYPRPPIQTHNGSKLGLTLSEQEVAELKALALRQNATLFMTLLTALKVLLCRYCGQDVVVVGIPAAGRSRVETEQMLGLFINMLPQRTDLSGNPSFLEALTRVREVALETFAHQDLPFERLVETIRPGRDTSRTPLFQVMFNVENVPKRTHEFPGLEVEDIDLDYGVAHLDLSVEVTETSTGANCTFVYSNDLFAAPTIERLAANFHVLVRELVADPRRPIGQLPMLASAERHQLVVSWNDTSRDYPLNRSIHELFYEQAAKTPDAVAVMFEDEALTYRELNRRSNRVARYLMGLGVGREVPVGLLVERSAAMVTGILGILKAGGCYVPLDTTYPEERVAFMLEDFAARVVLTERGVLGRLRGSQVRIVCLDSDWDMIARQPDGDVTNTASPSDPAYMLYTSGSTGRPKGVLGSHRGAVNFFHWMWESYPFESSEACCQKTSLSVVDSVRELFVPLLRGIPVAMVPDTTVRDPRRLVETLVQKRVTRIMLVPSLLDAILDVDIDLGHVLPRSGLWIASGETLSSRLATRFQERLPRRELLNIYGASEAPGATCYNIERGTESDRTVPIGRPIGNVEVYLLDHHLQPVPIGARGEIHIGGACVAEGYVGRPELTAERFIPHPFGVVSGERVYKTGDLARYRADGILEYLGRLDDQVKIRGYRVELGETEQVLRRSPAVREAVVVARENPQAAPELVAYVVTEADTPTVSGLRDHVRMHLPQYMVPSVFVFLEALPLTPNGKVDRRALPPPDKTRTLVEHRYQAARSPTEKVMVEIWQSVLGLERVGVHDDFFELGGHSLKATLLANRIEAALHIDLPVISLFRIPTVAGLAQLIEALRYEEATPGVDADETKG